MNSFVRVVVTLLFLLPMTSAAVTTEAECMALPFRYVGPEGTLPYRLLFLGNVQSSETSLLVVLHGRSDCGNDNRRQLETPALKALLRHRMPSSGRLAVVLPQCPEGKAWEAVLPTVRALAEAKARTLGVAPGRVALTGFSMGGGACYALMAQEGHPFARALAVCAGGDPLLAGKLSGVLRVVCGAEDRVVRPERVQALVSAASDNPRVKLTLRVLPGKDHLGAGEAAYDEAALDWLLGVGPSNP